MNDLDPPPSMVELINKLNANADSIWKKWFNNLYEYIKENVKTDFYTEVVKGNVTGHSIVHKFGAGTITATSAVVSQTGTYQTPTAAVNLEFLSSSAQDGVAGTGALEVKIIGLDSNWEEVEYTVTTNGTTPVTTDTGANNISLIRLYRWYVSQSGSYATTTTSSHVGTLTLRVSGGGTTWDTIPIAPFPLGQSVIGAYTIPINKTAYLLSKAMHIDANQAGDIYFFQRPLADDVATPFTGVRRLIEQDIGVKGQFDTTDRAPKGPYVGPCDIGMIGVNGPAGGAGISIEFELLLVDN